MIKIGHLYPYELDLYGENGNLKALKYALDKKELNVKLKIFYQKRKLTLMIMIFYTLEVGEKKN